MKPTLFYIIVVFLFLLIPFSGIGYFGTMITDNYSVEHAKTQLKKDTDKLTTKEIQEKTKKIEKVEKKIGQQQLLWIGLASIGFISGISLLRNKKKITKKNVAQQRL